MKRNEMIGHIKEDLLEKLKHRWLERGEVDKWVDLTANELLDMIEGLGMLPPEYIINYSPMMTTNAWELEDEEN